MSDFYQLHPPVSVQDTFRIKFFKIAPFVIFFVPVIGVSLVNYFLGAFNEPFFQEPLLIPLIGEYDFTFFHVLLVLFTLNFFIWFILTIFLIIPKERKNISKKAFLRMYGKNSNLLCKKIEVFPRPSLGVPYKKISCLIEETLFDTKLQLQFKAKDYAKGSNEQVLCEIKEGDNLPVVYNPDDPSDFIFANQ